MFLYSQTLLSHIGHHNYSPSLLPSRSSKRPKPNDGYSNLKRGTLDPKQCTFIIWNWQLQTQKKTYRPNQFKQLCESSWRIKDVSYDYLTSMIRILNMNVTKQYYRTPLALNHIVFVETGQSSAILTKCYVIARFIYNRTYSSQVNPNVEIGVCLKVKMF